MIPLECSEIRLGVLLFHTRVTSEVNVASVDQEAKSKLHVAGVELSLDSKMEIRHYFSVYLSHGTDDFSVALVEIFVD